MRRRRSGIRDAAVAASNSVEPRWGYVAHQLRTTFVLQNAKFDKTGCANDNLTNPHFVFLSQSTSLVGVLPQMHWKVTGDKEEHIHR